MVEIFFFKFSNLLPTDAFVNYNLKNKAAMSSCNRSSWTLTFDVVTISLQTSHTQLTDGQGSPGHPLWIEGPSNPVFMYDPPEPKGALHQHLLTQILDGKVLTTQ